MNIETFLLERTQSLWEHTVDYNLTETGVHPFTLSELLSKAELASLLETRLGYGHTNGSLELRRAICGLYDSADLDNVLVTNGSAEANFLAIWSLLEPGDEVVLMLPNYMQIWGLARSFGAKVQPFHLQEERSWHLDLDQLRTLVSKNTRLIAVCNPNNPTGSVLTEEEMQEIVALARQADAWLYADEVYRGAELQGEETDSFWGKYEKAVVCCGLSKAYALPGLRLGWLVGPEKFIATAWSYRDYTSIACGILSDGVATLALQPTMRARILERNRKILRSNLDTLISWVQEHSEFLQFVPPVAGGLAFLKYHRQANSSELSRKLREEKSVFVVAGDCFGLDGYLRIGIGPEPEYFKTGLRLIGEYLSQSA